MYVLFCALSLLGKVCDNQCPQVFFNVCVCEYIYSVCECIFMHTRVCLFGCIHMYVQMCGLFCLQIVVLLGKVSKDQCPHVCMRVGVCEYTCMHTHL